MARLILIGLFALATAVWAQDDETEDAAAGETAPDSVDEMSDEDFDDFDLGGSEDHTEEDEDVFKPSDVVSYQQSVPFPVDI